MQDLIPKLKEAIKNNAKSPSEKSHKKILNMFSELCQNKVKLSIKPRMQMTCAHCDKFINPDDMNSFYAMGCNCCTTWHKKCLQKKAIKVTKGFLQTAGDLAKIKCRTCKKTIDYTHFRTIIFGEKEYDRIVHEAGIGSEPEKFSIPDKNKIHEVICEICKESIEFKRIEKDVVTLDCDHKFCKKCIKKSFERQMDDKTPEIGCPKCQRTVPPNIIENCAEKKDKNYLNKIQKYNFWKAGVNLVQCPNCSELFSDEKPEKESPEKKPLLCNDCEIKSVHKKKP